MRGDWVVRLPTWLGDTVMALPTIRAIERDLRGKLVLWGPDPYGRLLAAAGIGGTRMPYRRAPGVRGIRDAAGAVAALRRVRPRGILILPNAFEPALLSVLAGVPTRVGYATDGRGRLLTEPVPPPHPLLPLHDADRYAALLRPLGVPAPRAHDALIEAPPDAVARAAAGVPRNRPLLGIVPGCANGPAKQWPPARFAELAELAARRWGALPMLLGGPGDLATIAAVRDRCGVPCLEMAADLDILDMTAALALCWAVVSNDTGPAHLAAALGRPTVVLFGPTDPSRTRPRGARVRIVSASVFCQPCGAQVCPLDHRCLEELTCDAVVSTLADVWDAPPVSTLRSL